MLKKLKSKKYYILAAFVVLTIIVYILFFKPNPVVRFNRNDFITKGNGKSALVIDAPAEIDGVGKKITVNVIVDTEGNYVNAVQSYLEFDPRVLEVTNTKTEQSFCKFYPENNYSNEKGIIRLACGSPYPGFKGRGTVQVIEFLAKAITTTELKLNSQSMVLANDGKGTNLLKETSPVSIKIKAAL
jgi:hypothetical protein